ncbi:MAG: hypothetical protein P8O16_07080 [Algoriphagus sp.]|uniref:HEAT repeat domain-containing protein n=1 Tax=Algoriphagus sp. TaxID=1872435 RepID=UPI00262D60AE|nr:hypothetical protein [Algoriphagus sp.]MDG1277027.1 hypothetical protein [Algoriphagus sp.]
MAQAKKKTSEFDPQELLAFLRQDELDYPAGAKKFGEAALPLLAELIEGNDENLSIKAAYLVGYISGTGADEILKGAADRGIAPVRIAAAYGAQKREPKIAEAILQRSLDDNDPSVVKFAMRSASALNMEKNFKSKIDHISKTFLNDSIKADALNLMKKMK